MNQLFLRFAALLLCATQATAAPERIGDADHADWSAIGRINVAGFDSGGMCTGTLIAPDLVLTAAHCLFAVRGIDRARPGQVHFLAGWLKGTYAAHRIAARIHVHPDYAHSGKTDFRMLRSDLAILRLAEPITQIAPLPLAAAGTTTDRLDLIGYRADRANALSRQSDCTILARRDGVIGLDCTVVAGSSGGPVLAATDQGWRVIGIVIAGNAGSGAVQSVAAEVNAARMSDLIP